MEREEERGCVGMGKRPWVERDNKKPAAGPLALASSLNSAAVSTRYTPFSRAPRTAWEAHTPSAQHEEEEARGLASSAPQGFPSPSSSPRSHLPNQPHHSPMPTPHTPHLQHQREEDDEDEDERAMGIAGLLPLLKSVTHSVHLREYNGMTAGT